MDGGRTILTCFAGRRENMEILTAYADELHSRGFIESMHIWDFSRDESDGAWLRETFEKSPFLPTAGYEYKDSGETLSAGGSLEVGLKGQDNAHLLLVDAEGRDAAEIAFGAFGNSWNFVRTGRQGQTLSARAGATCDRNEWRRVRLTYGEDGTLRVRAQGEALMEAFLGARKLPMKILLAGWDGGTAVSWRLPDRGGGGYARLFSVANKNSWVEYYSHYTKGMYPDRVIVKCDDDIAFIDVEQFGDFIRRRRQDRESLLVFPSIVNNGVSAHHQQRMGLIPASLGEFPYDTACGRLWSDGALCMRLHEHFVMNHREWTKMAKERGSDIRIPVGHRTSINFFALLSDDLPLYSVVGWDDEHDITAKATKFLGRHNSMDMRMTVSHLSFNRQRSTGLDRRKVLALYRELAWRYLGGGGLGGGCPGESEPKRIKVSFGRRTKADGLEIPR
jgi:hypothetical protein